MFLEVVMDDVLAFENLLKKRKATRSFLPIKIDENLIKKIFSCARFCPSNCNTQPWFSAVVSGEKLQLLREKILISVNNGEFTYDFPYDGKYIDIYRDRQRNAAKALYQAMNIKKKDKLKRESFLLENFSFFGAPHVAFLFLPGCFTENGRQAVREAADLGIYSQTLMLSMAAYGVYSCPQTSLSFVADTVRNFLGISQDLRLLFGISFGYPNKKHPSYNLKVGRAPLSENVRFFDSSES